MTSSGMLRCVDLVSIDVLEILVRRLLFTTSVVPSSPVLVAVKIEALLFSETSFHARPTRRNIQEDDII
jgi:hypothetical protein